MPEATVGSKVREVEDLVELDGFESRVALGRASDVKKKLLQPRPRHGRSLH
jgi:hypothetical protein